MLQNLSISSPGEIEADVLVIGAGIAGLILASRLSEKGINVVVLESGDRHQESETHPLNQVVMRGQAYQGAEHGRFRCLGGTSTRWGGAMLPFLREDMSAPVTRLSPGWGSASYDQVKSYLPQVEALFGLPTDDYRSIDTPKLPDFSPRLAKWPKFKSRNVATLLQDGLEAVNGPAIWLNATATGFELDEAGCLAKVTAHAPCGKRLSVKAKTTAIAAGAIESTRLLLLLDADAGRKKFAPDDVLGRYFYDHLSAAVADIIPNDIAAFRETFGYRFQNRVMRSLRYELNRATERQNLLPAAFLHVSFIADEAGGFSALRDVSRKLQRRKLPSFAEFSGLAKDSGWLSRAIWWRFAKGRLLAPPDAKFELHQVIEQVPMRENCISLSDTSADRHGCPHAIIDWNVHADDVQNFNKISALFLKNWQTGPLSNIATANARPHSDVAAALTSGGGIFHPGGSARIGSSPHDGVVDGDLKVFRVPNLRVISTAAFPSGGTANPTLMLILFAFRAADHIHAELSGH